jgi:glutathione S-transferase
MIRLHLIPWSTNVERVSLALAHKGLPAEAVAVDPADRSSIVELSGQELVPVIEDDERVIADSTAILEYLERAHPEPPLYPAAPARRAEAQIFIDWFNQVWKVAPNAIAAEIESGAPDESRVAVLAGEMASALDWFESLLDGRDHLLGEAVSAADFAAFPFLKYATRPPEPGDDEVFHRVLHEHQRLDDGHRRLAAWIDRIDALPRAV